MSLRRAINDKPLGLYHEVNADKACTTSHYLRKVDERIQLWVISLL